GGEHLRQLHERGSQRGDGGDHSRRPPPVEGRRAFQRRSPEDPTPEVASEGERQRQEAQGYVESVHLTTGGSQGAGREGSRLEDARRDPTVRRPSFTPGSRGRRCIPPPSAGRPPRRSPRRVPGYVVWMAAACVARSPAIHVARPRGPSRRGRGSPSAI